MRDFRWLTALHEASHFALAWLYAWWLGTLTIEGDGETYGCVDVEPRSGVDLRRLYVPGKLPPRPVFIGPDLRLEAEQQVIVLLAGLAGEDELLNEARSPAAPTRPYSPPARPVTTASAHPSIPPAVPMIAAPVPSPELRAEAARMVARPGPTDRQQAQGIARMLYAEDRRGADAWLSLQRAQARAHISDMRPEIIRLADMLHSVGVIDGEVAVSILAGTAGL